MSAGEGGPRTLLTLGQLVDLAGLEGSLMWLGPELAGLAAADGPAHGVTPAGWGELADAVAHWRASTTALLDAVIRHKGGAR